MITSKQTLGFIFRRPEKLKISIPSYMKHSSYSLDSKNQRLIDIALSVSGKDFLGFIERVSFCSPYTYERRVKRSIKRMGPSAVTYYLSFESLPVQTLKCFFEELESQLGKQKLLPSWFKAQPAVICLPQYMKFRLGI